MTEQANPAAGTDSNLGLARRVICGVLVVAALTFTISGHSLGQSYPTKVIKLIVPFGPGGPTDLAARLASQIVQTSLGKVMIIENRPGAGGAIGTRAVATSEARWIHLAASRRDGAVA